MESNKILFSIIVPVYNTGKYINKCLTTIKNAINKDCEVIIVNDGSTDNSEQVIKKFIQSLPNEYKDNFIYKFKENKGLADTKNVGISLARGQYISVIDSDDYISEDFYDIARKHIKEGYEIIIYDLYIIFDKSCDEELKNYVGRAFNEEKENFKTGIISGAMQGSSCNKIIKKDLYKPYEFPTNKQYEDTAVTPFILMDTDKIKYVPYPLYYYLQREKSIVATNTYITAFYKICENITNQLENRKNNVKYEEVIKEFFVERSLEIMYDDYNKTKNKKEFLTKLKDFNEKNKKTIQYVLDKKMVYDETNHYSPRQRELLNRIFQDIYDEKYENINKNFFKRKLVNYLREIYRAFIQLIKVVIRRA